MANETVLQVIIRCDSKAGAAWELTVIRNMLANEPGARLDAAGIFDADIFDAPDLDDEVVGIPA